MSNNNDIHIHPSLSPRIYVIIPYRFYRINNITKEEIEETNRVLSIQRLYVNSFNEIESKVCEALNLSASSEVTVDSIGEDIYDEGFTFGNSVHVEVKTELYSFGISFDCYTSINAYQWRQNAGWK